MTRPWSEIAQRPPPGFMEDPYARMGGSDVLQVLRRHSMLIICVIILGTTATAFWLAFQVPTYSATAAILLRSAELPSETADATSSPGIITSTQVFTEAEVLQSRDFAWRLAERLELLSDPRFNPAIAEPQPPSSFNQLLFRLGVSDLDVVQDMSIARQRAEVIERLLNVYSVAASEKHNVIDIKAQHSDPVLAARIANETARLYIERQTSEQLNDLDRDIDFVRERSREISGNLSRHQARMTSLMLENQLLDETAVRTFVAERARLLTRLEAAGTNAPDHNAISARVQEIETELSKRVGAEIRFSEFETALRTETERLDGINKRLDELEAQRQSPTPNVRQISDAEVPSTPYGPNSRSTLAVSFVVFGLIGAVCALMRENLDHRVLHQEQVESLTKLPVLAPLARLPRALLRRHQAPHHCVVSNVCPGFSNAVRALVSAAMDGVELGRGSVVLIGSANAGEGKSSIASCMAVAAAQDDLRVLLIDLDVRRFGLTGNFALPRGQDTFGDVLSSCETFSAAVKRTGHAGIDLLNFRAGSTMSRRALRQKCAIDVLSLMRGAYDLIIIDTPPFLASEEAGRLNEIVDKAILVSRWGEADRETLAKTAHLMHRSGLRMIGIAINGVSPRAARSYGFISFRNNLYRRVESPGA